MTVSPRAGLASMNGSPLTWSVVRGTHRRLGSAVEMDCFAFGCNPSSTVRVQYVCELACRRTDSPRLLMRGYPYATSGRRVREFCDRFLDAVNRRTEPTKRRHPTLRRHPACVAASARPDASDTYSYNTARPAQHDLTKNLDNAPTARSPHSNTPPRRSAGRSTHIPTTRGKFRTSACGTTTATQYL